MSDFQESSYSHVVVTGAGTPEVNGAYVRDGLFSEAYKYHKWTMWAGMQCKFTIFKCKVRDDTIRWYISIVPDRTLPGTTNDIDFYSAAISSTSALNNRARNNTYSPSRTGWENHNLMGKAPPPTLEIVMGHVPPLTPHSLGLGPLRTLPYPYPYHPHPTMWAPPHVVGDVGAAATNLNMFHGPNVSVAAATAATPPMAVAAVAAEPKPTPTSEQWNADNSIIQKLEKQKSEWIKELETLTKEKQTLQENNEKLSAMNKQQQDEIENLTKDESMEMLAEKNQALEKDLSKQMAQNIIKQELMEDLIKQREKVETNLKAEIASLRKTIATSKRQGKQQKKSDKALVVHEKDDEEEQQDTLSKNDGPFWILVQGAGAHGVNGTYSQDGYSENACRYSKVGKHKGKNCKFYILLCQTDDKTKLWYITIVPDGFSPGTTNDIDFYFAPVTSSSSRIPPLKGWDYAQKGRFPAPTLSHHNIKKESKNSSAKAPGKAATLSDKKSPAVQTMEGVVEQQQQKGAHDELEISTLRAAVDDLNRKNDELRQENYKLLLEKIAHYEQKEHEQLKDDNKALREKVAQYKRKEKEQQKREKEKMALQQQEQATRCEPETGGSLKKAPEDVHDSPPRNAKRARPDDENTTKCSNNSQEKEESKDLLV